MTFAFGFVIGFLWADHRVLSNLRDGERVTGAEVAFVVGAGLVVGWLLYVFA